MMVQIKALQKHKNAGELPYFGLEPTQEGAVELV